MYFGSNLYLNRMSQFVVFFVVNVKKSFFQCWLCEEEGIIVWYDMIQCWLGLKVFKFCVYLFGFFFVLYLKEQYVNFRI